MSYRDLLPQLEGDLAREQGVGFVLESPTWRASQRLDAKPRRAGRGDRARRRDAVGLGARYAAFCSACLAPDTSSSA